MKKQKKGRKLSRKSAPREALLKALAGALLVVEKIKTTEAKAKEVSGFVEKQIARAKSGDLRSRRLLARDFSPEIVGKLIKEIAPKYKERKGGCTRIIKLGPRKSDGAKMAIIELIK